jgi:hypothetical protein
VSRAPRIEGDVPALDVRVQALWRGEELAGAARVALIDDAVQLALLEPRARLVVVALGELDGATWDGAVLALHVTAGDVLELRDAPHLAGLAARLEAAVCAFPEQTLSLRGFGSERSAPGSDHDRWFDALLVARGVAEETRTVATQLGAFDAARLRAHAEHTLVAFAQARHPRDGADQRALHAELEEVAAPYAAQLARLEVAAAHVTSDAGDHRYARWRDWTRQVGRAFHAADDAWLAMVPVLGDSRGASGRLWRRLLRRDRP